MLFVDKSDQAPKKFTEIVRRHRDYLSLSESGADRNHLKLILLNEQGCLCPFCERSLGIEDSTIEHFQPKSTFPRLQLDYHNLFACCQVCNGNKTDHLLPAYIFDERSNPFDPKHLILNRHEDFRFHFFKKGEKECHLINPKLENPTKAAGQQYPTWMYHHTIEILRLNDRARLSEPRRLVMNWVLSKTETMTKAELIAQYRKFQTPRTESSPIPRKPYHRLEPFVGMILYLLAERLRSKGVDLVSL
jgi:uncharacterized protein (TIGR02646 family)